MAATEIQHELGQLREVAVRLGSVSRSLTVISTSLDALRDKTYPIWEGAAAEQFDKNGEDLKKRLGDFNEDVGVSKTVLEQAVEAYERTESSVSAAVSELSTEGIF